MHSAWQHFKTKLFGAKKHAYCIIVSYFYSCFHGANMASFFFTKSKNRFSIFGGGIGVDLGSDSVSRFSIGSGYDSGSKSDSVSGSGSCLGLELFTRRLVKV